MSTSRAMVPASPLRWEPVPVPPPRRWPLAVAPFVLLVAMLVASVNVVVPYYSLSPGSARPVNDLIVVPGEHAHPPDGELLLTTVALQQATAMNAFLGWLDPDVDVVERDRIIPPNTSGDEYRQLNAAYMEDSKRTAVVVALRRLGHQITEQGEGAAILNVLEGHPAEGRVRPGDVIVSVAGRPVATASDAVAAIRTHQPGETVTLALGGSHVSSSHSVQIPLGAHPEDPSQPFIGIELATFRQRFDLPVPVEIQSSSIGGPSAGLAFTLAVIDFLTTGELTGGRQVAVTGTIELDGSVGRVGGVAQKTAAVRESGADLFIVPKGEEQVARARAGSDLEIVAVTNLEEALAALGSVGGDLTALGPPPGGRG